MRLFSKSDIRYTFRQLARSPGFALLSVFVLAGGLGLSIYTFTVSYIIAYKPIDLPNGEIIVELCADGGFGNCLPFKAYEFAAIRDDITQLDNVGIYRELRAYVEWGEALHQAAIVQTDWNQFQLTGVAPLQGRTLLATDQQPGAEPVAVLAYDFWQLAFDGNPGMLDSYIDMGGRPTRVVGIMPEGYSFPRWSDIWSPAPPELLAPAVNELTLVSAVGLLQPGISRSDASRELENLMFRMRQQYPPEILDQDTNRIQMIKSTAGGFVATLPGKDMGSLASQIMLLIVNLLAGMVFLLACINVGTLFLARTNERLKDLSIRVALGAPRARLMTQTMGESIVIALLGAALAVLLAGIGMESLNLVTRSLLDEEGLQFWIDFEIVGVSVLAALLFAVLTVLITTALPAWKLINGNFNAVMRDGTRGAVGLRAGRFSRTLVVLAIALITVFLFVGAIGINALYKMSQSLVIYDEEDLHSLEIETGSQYDSADARLQFYRVLQDTLLDNPAIQAVTTLGVVGKDVPLEVEGQDYLAPGDRPTTTVQVLAGDLNVIGANLLAGRELNGTDNRGSAPAALISRALATRLWPNQSPVGQSLRIGGQGSTGRAEQFRIVGMVSDTPVDSTEMFTQDLDMIYVPLGQMDTTQILAIVRSDEEDESVAMILGAAVRSLNSGITFNIVSWTQFRQANSMLIRFITTVLALCCLFAFLISVAGIFGLTRNAVLLQSQEIGTRRALGASDRTIGRVFTLRGTRQLLIGFVAAGLVTLPVTLILNATMGIDYLISGLYMSAAVIALLYACIIAAIRQPIRKLLRQEPAALLHHQ